MRSLPNYSFSMHTNYSINLAPSTMITFFMALVSIFSIIAFLCGSHNFTGRKEEKTVRLGGVDQKKSGISKLQSSISSKAQLMVKKISWRKLQHDDDDDDHDQERSSSSSGDDEEAVWKRTIIMGGRCRPLEFSGKILYDSHGNPLHDSLIRPTHGNFDGK